MSSDFTKLKSGLTIGSLSADPVTGINGDVYYNTTLNKFRKFENGSWSDLDTISPPSSLNVIEFVAGVNAWTVPADVYEIFVLGIGGGGGGTGGQRGQGGSTTNGGGGGSGGESAVPYLTKLDVTPGETLTITIGLGGISGRGAALNSWPLPSALFTDSIALQQGSLGSNTIVQTSKNTLNFLGARASSNTAFSTGGQPANASPRLSTNRAPMYITGLPGGNGGGQGASGTTNWGINGSSGTVNLYHNSGSIGGGGGRSAASDRGGGGGGGGANGLGIGGPGGHGSTPHPNTLYTPATAMTINSVSRVSNIVTVNINTAGYSTRQFNIGEYVYIHGLSAGYNGWYTVIDRPTSTSLSFYNFGADETPGDQDGFINSAAFSRKAKYEGILNGMTEGVRVEALEEGLSGNTITLTFNGTDSLQDQVNTWNAANPGNRCWVVLGDPNQVPWNGQSLTLSGGRTDNYYPTGGSGQTNLKAFGSGGGGGGGGSSEVGTNGVNVGAGGLGGRGMSGKVTIIY
jgi:hypothetical protein